MNPRSQERPAIPEHISRTVRQQCGFGCAICGMPFFEYEHIEEWADVKEHTVENILLLCPNHHSSKTTKKLSADRLR
jgi:predicted restriction endonuclease